MPRHVITTASTDAQIREWSAKPRLSRSSFSFQRAPCSPHKLSRDHEASETRKPDRHALHWTLIPLPRKLPFGKVANFTQRPPPGPLRGLWERLKGGFRASRHRRARICHQKREIRSAKGIEVAMHAQISTAPLATLSYKRFSPALAVAVSIPTKRSCDGRLEYTSNEPTFSRIGPRDHMFQDPSMLTPRRRPARTS